MPQPSVALLLHIEELLLQLQQEPGRALLPAPEPSSVLDSGGMSPPFRRDPRRETGQSSCPVRAERGDLRCNDLGTIFLHHQMTTSLLLRALFLSQSLLVTGLRPRGDQSRAVTHALWLGR